MRAGKASVHRKFGPVENGYRDSYVVEHFVPLFANLTTRWFFPNAKWCSPRSLDFIPSDNTNSVWLPESGPEAAKRWPRNSNE
jgi:hypothetical protein